MDKAAVLFAQIAGLKKSFGLLDWTRLGRVNGNQVEHLLEQYFRTVGDIKKEVPELFKDLFDFDFPKGNQQSNGVKLYSLIDVQPIINNIEYILEVWVNSRIEERGEKEIRPKRIFISHGRSQEWYKLQPFIEKNLGFQTLELAQEPAYGRTLLQKLNDEANRCGFAVIVMTGDDIIKDDEIRARENVMHEIGFFQGRYGLHNITILYEEGVNIPSNILGIVYIPFPKNTIEAAFSALARELRAQIL